VLQILPDTAARARRELDVQLALGAVLLFTKGRAAPEVLAVYTRAHELCQQVGEPLQRLTVLQRLTGFAQNRGDLQTARELIEQRLLLAQRQHDPVLLIQVYSAKGMHLIWEGELVSARSHLEQALTLAARQPEHVLAFHGEAPLVHALNNACWVLWMLGYPDQSLQRLHETLARVRGLSHAYELVRALTYAATHHARRGEWVLTLEQAEAAIALATERGVESYIGHASFWRGLALVVQGQGEAGIAAMRPAVAAWRAAGIGVVEAEIVGLLAEAYGWIGHVEEGLRLIAEALALVDQDKGSYYAAEVYRVKGDLLLQQAVPDPQQAEACFHRAIDIARRQQAKSRELRAANEIESAVAAAG
jgi:tetratricopeptide (TPR) repeat protein